MKKLQTENIFNKAVGFIKDALYGLSVKLYRPKKKVVSMRGKAIKETIFFWGFAIIPLLVLALNMIFINFNSILLAFKTYNEQGVATFTGLDNVIQVFKDYFNDRTMQKALTNSLTVYVISAIVTAILPIFFSYYLYKKACGSEVFKVFLMLPSIISSVATVLVFKSITDIVLPDVLLKYFGIDIGNGLLSESKTKFGTVLFYTMYMSFGGGMLTFLGAMNSVDKSVVEAGTLDGVSFLQELWHIVLPKSYTVISIGFITGIASIFTNDFGLYAFYGYNADSTVATLGYNFVVATKRAQADSNFSIYCYWAAWGLVSSLVVIPLTFLARHIIYGYGPSED